DREFERVGGTDTLRSTARILVATNRNLESLVQNGMFREDLYHRLNVVTMEVPPLRHRREDIPTMVDQFLAEFGGRHRGFVPSISDSAKSILLSYSWPGNVRELRNCIESM